MRIAWLCGLPYRIQEEGFGNENLGAQATWSWVLGHLPPPSGVSLHLICPSTKTRTYQQVHYHGSTVHLLPCPKGRLQTGYFLDLWAHRNLLKQIQADVVHGWGIEGGHAWVARMLAPKKAIVQVQGVINAYREFLPSGPGTCYLAALERWTLGHARHVFVESRFSGQLVEPYCGPDCTLHHVDHPLRGEFLDAELHADPVCNQVLFVGALNKRKGVLDAIRAFRTLRRKDWTFIIVGSGDEVEMRSVQEEIQPAVDSGCTIQHIPHASGTALVQLMQNSSVFLLPSSMDTGPTALKEAMAMGLWPVCYDVAGPAEYIRRFEWGRLAAHGDPDALADALSWSMDHVAENHLRRQAVADQIREALCGETIWKTLLLTYNEIISESATPPSNHESN